MGVIDPVVSSCLGTAWCLARVAFGIGYTRADKEMGKGRAIGSVPSQLSQLLLLITSGMAVYQTIMD